MKAEVVKVTRKGQTTVPKWIREKMRIREGDLLLVELREGEIVLRPIPKLEELSGVDAGYGYVEDVKREVDRMREEYG